MVVATISRPRPNLYLLWHLERARGRSPTLGKTEQRPRLQRKTRKNLTKNTVIRPEFRELIRRLVPGRPQLSATKYLLVPVSSLYLKSL